MCIGPEGDMHGVSAAECAVRMARAGADIGRCHPVAFRQSSYTLLLTPLCGQKNMLASHNRVLRGQKILSTRKWH